MNAAFARPSAARSAPPLVYLAIFAVMGLLFWRLPTGFLPDEDMGAVFTLVAEPSGATLPRTDTRARRTPAIIS